MQGALADGFRVEIAMGVLQVVATLSLAWIAGVRYLFHELGSLFERGETVPLGGVADPILGVLILGVWVSGFLLLSMVYAAFGGISAAFSPRGQLFFVVLSLAGWAVGWVVSMTLIMLWPLVQDKKGRHYVVGLLVFFSVGAGLVVSFFL